MKIACIEDNNEDLILIKKTLSGISPSSEVYSYRYLNDFLQSEYPYDLVITDLALPDAYGPDAVKRIRKVTGKPIIVFSGIGGKKASIEILKSLKKSGATLFLSKNKNGYELLADSLHQFH